jgi:hypothetical protein
VPTRRIITATADDLQYITATASSGGTVTWKRVK